MQQTAIKHSESTTSATAVITARQLAGQAGIVIAATALVALCAHISVPLGFSPVPITLQPFAVVLLGLLLAPRLSFAAMSLYLLEGAFGLPVFSPHGPGGLGQIIGYTGGYLLAAPFAAALAGMIYGSARRSGKRSLVTALAGAAAGDLVLLSTGALWMGVLTHASFPVLLRVSIAPFLVSDAAKVIAAAACAQIFASFTKRSGESQSV
jgi:biotin transport system substrate-specific component